MKKLNEILPVLLGKDEVFGSTDVEIQDLRLDSREVLTGDAFIAIKGALTDGHKYIDQAIKTGATVVFCQNKPVKLSTKVTYVILQDIQNYLWSLAADFYEHPTRKLQLIGVTGTNGKTTVATMFFQLMRTMDIGCGLISTVKIQINEKIIPTQLTTPDVVTLNRILAQMAQEKCQFAVMEVSSHAIDQERIKGLEFKIGAFTNLTHDHLDYHNTFKEYLNVKKRFFDLLDKKAYAITNADDKNGMVMVQNTKANISRYALRSNAEYKAKVLEHDFTGMHIQIDQLDFYTRMVGRFNVYNLLAVIAIADKLSFDRLEVLKYLSQITSVEGRFDIIRDVEDGITGIVDYAHTPDALENVLRTITEVNRIKANVTTVVGAGGDRDKKKRPLMADIATRYSNQVILTSDNPRTEDPESILNDMEAGVLPVYSRNVLRITDRRSAIKTAVQLAGKGGIILIAGKGHEKYQDINGVKSPFDDKKILQSFLQKDN